MLYSTPKAPEYCLTRLTNTGKWGMHQDGAVFPVEWFCWVTRSYKLLWINLVFDTQAAICLFILLKGKLHVSTAQYIYVPPSGRRETHKQESFCTSASWALTSFLEASRTVLCTTKWIFEPLGTRAISSKYIVHSICIREPEYKLIK